MNTSGKSVSEKSLTIKHNITFTYDDTRRFSLYSSSVNGMFVPGMFSTISPDLQQSLQYMISSQTNSAQYRLNFSKADFLISPTDAFSFTLHGICVPGTGFISPFTFFNIPAVMMTSSFRLYEDFK